MTCRQLSHLGMAILMVLSFFGTDPRLCAWPLGGPLYSRSFPHTLPPSYYGYNLDDTNPGYYGGGRYRENYSYGRGYGLANYPGPLPNYPSPSLSRGYRGGYPAPLIIQGPPLPRATVAHLEIEVPEGAELWLEGVKSQQTGKNREFVTPPLTLGTDYAYEIKARWTEKGAEVVQTQTIAIHAGDRIPVRFPVTLPSDILSLPLESNR